MAINKKNYPFVVLEDFVELQKHCQKKANEESEIVTYKYAPDELMIAFRDRETTSKFAFEILNPTPSSPDRKTFADIIFYRLKCCD